MKLYMLKGCPYAHRAVIALREKALPFELTFYDGARRPPELDAVSPRAKSPTLFDGDRAVYESLVVLEYLEDKYPERPLLPKDAAGRAAVRMLQTRVSDELMQKQHAVVLEVHYKKSPDQAKVAELIRAFVEAMKPWDAYLAGRTFACGDEFTLADITLYTLFPSAKAIAGITIPEEHKNLRAFCDRMAARPTTAVPQPPAT